MNKFGPGLDLWAASIPRLKDGSIDLDNYTSGADPDSGRPGLRADSHDSYVNVAGRRNMNSKGEYYYAGIKLVTASPGIDRWWKGVPRLLHPAYDDRKGVRNGIPSRVHLPTVSQKSTSSSKTKILVSNPEEQPLEVKLSIQNDPSLPEIPVVATRPQSLFGMDGETLIKNTSMVSELPLSTCEVEIEPEQKLDLEWLMDQDGGQKPEGLIRFKFLIRWLETIWNFFIR